jgi:hypothetical protein
MQTDHFWKGLGYLNVVTGVFGIGSEVLRDVIGPGYFLYGILLPAWFMAVGWKLYRLGKPYPRRCAMIQRNFGVTR